MSFWKAASVKEQPRLIMDSWRIVEVVWSVGDLAQARARSEQEIIQLLQKLNVDFSNPARPTSRHLVGYVAQNREGRLSSAIIEFDPARLICRTSTGRIYEVVGAPGWNDDARFVLWSWTALFMITEWQDVTAEMLGTVATPYGLEKTLH